ncbi:DUF6456 domain-containing protein [Paracoccus sp. p3-h83]|uniref:DUF6456 domain-containing protein n=1 Tax=Paracoccus sp. p3-h83 TaxID=3342805 RepID=UPI0035B94CF7
MTTCDPCRAAAVASSPARAVPWPATLAAEPALAALPDDARLYLAHVEGGVPLRELARSLGCHPSTILRRVRRTEIRREDPLIDAALSRLASTTRHPAAPVSAHQPKDTAMTAPLRNATATSLRAEDETRRILRRLAEPNACLAIAEGMDKGVVMRGSVRTAILDRHLAEAFALNDWIAAQPLADAEGGARPTRIARYRLTAAGRQHLRALIEEADARQPGCLPRAGDFGPADPVCPPNAAPDGMAEPAAQYDAPHAGPAAGAAHKIWGDRVLADPQDGRRRRMRVNLAESPLTAMARRRDRDGTLFLTDDLVAAGERLREDFELAQMGPRVAQNWERFLTGGGDRGQFSQAGGGGTSGERARDRVAAALRDLGPGLGDMVLRVCCFLEGVETAEQRLGWSARSGKIVLRIALLRLKRHYADTYGAASPMIG